MSEKQPEKTGTDTTEESGSTAVTSSAEQEVADAQRVDDAMNGDQAGRHAADGEPTQADQQK